MQKFGRQVRQDIEEEIEKMKETANWRRLPLQATASATVYAKYRTRFGEPEEDGGNSPLSKDSADHSFSPVGSSRDLSPAMKDSALLQRCSEICTEISSAGSLLGLNRALARAQHEVAEALDAAPQ